MNAPAAGGLPAPGHLLDEQAAAGAERCDAAGRRRRGSRRRRRARPSRATRSRRTARRSRPGSPGSAPGPVGQPEPAQPLAGVAALLGRERDRGDPRLAVLRGVHRERPPAAAQVEQRECRDRARASRPGQVQLVPLRVGQPVAGFVAGPVPARVGHRGIEDQPVEGDRNVVVARDHGPVPGPAVPAAGLPDLGFRRPGRPPEHPEPARRQRRGRDHVRPSARSPARSSPRPPAARCRGGLRRAGRTKRPAQSLSKVTFEVEFPAHVGTREPEFPRRPQRPAQRQRRAQHDGGRVGRARFAAIPGAQPHRQPDAAPGRRPGDRRGGVRPPPRPPGPARRVPGGRVVLGRRGHPRSRVSWLTFRYPARKPASA